MVVFFDIDGTIVDDASQEIPASALRAVERLTEKGHIPVVNTGRPFSHIDPRVREMAFQGWVCGCGMEIRLGERWLVRRRLPEEIRRKTVEAAHRCRMAALYEADGGTILLEKSGVRHPSGEIEAARMIQKGFSVREFEPGEAPEFIKLVTYDTPGCRRSEFLAGMEMYYTCIDRGGTMLELVKKGCSKGAGMTYLLEKLGASRDQVLAIGDSTNDLPMFSLAGRTVCMGGGMEELKAQAEYVTAPVLEDGIEKALTHFGLIDTDIQ